MALWNIVYHQDEESGERRWTVMEDLVATDEGERLLRQLAEDIGMDTRGVDDEGIVNDLDDLGYGDVLARDLTDDETARLCDELGRTEAMAQDAAASAFREAVSGLRKTVEAILAGDGRKDVPVLADPPPEEPGVLTGPWVYDLTPVGEPVLRYRWCLTPPKGYQPEAEGYELNSSSGDWGDIDMDVLGLSEADRGRLRQWAAWRTAEER